jgi:hypothetical protein
MLASVALKPQTAKPSGGYPTALPTSPRRCRAFRSFSRHRQGCRTGSEGFQSNHQPNRKSILGFRGLFCRLPDLCPLKQQSRRRYATDGFALLPHTYVFLDGIVRLVEPAVKPVGCLHLRPRPPTQAGTTPVRPKKNSAGANAHAAKLLSKDEARRIAASVAKLPELLSKDRN